jgi:hypothetical protein
MRESAFGALAAAGMLSATLFIAPGAPAMPLIGPSLTTAVHAQQVRNTCRRGQRCSFISHPRYYVAHPYYYVSRPYLRHREPSEAWGECPLRC